VSNDWYQDLINFHEQVVLDNFPKQPYIPDKQKKLLRGELIIEEISETLDAIDKNDLVKIADGICDSIVVLLGTAVTYGIDIRPIWDEIHKTNMAKKGGKLRADGKLLKPEGWKPPEVERLIKEQQGVFGTHTIGVL
jgi:NTP pyrophosphatase (non-canonical NTP hydrolase)